MNQRIECTISGRVQMVMFRDFVRRKAISLGLTGEVFNIDSGHVFVVAEGNKEKLKDFIKYLHKGSLLSDVKTVSVNELEPTGEFSKFTINIYGKK